MALLEGGSAQPEAYGDVVEAGMAAPVEPGAEPRRHDADDGEANLGSGEVVDDNLDP